MRTFAFFLALALMANVGLTQGGTNDGLGLTSAVNAGAFDASDKAVATGDVLSVRIDDNFAGVTGQVIALAGDLVPCNFPICVDLDANPATCEVELGINLFFLIDPGASVFPLTLPGSGFQIGLPIPASASLFSAPDDEALRLQAACANPASPLGISITNIVEAFVGTLTLPGPASDDGNLAVSLGSGIDFYGVTETNLFINSNGNLTFGSGDMDFNSSEGEMLSDQPRIAPAWTDISPNVDGQITYVVDRACGGDVNSITVNYDAIPNFGEGPGNNLHTFSATLYANGDIDMSWPMLDSNGDNLIAGISPGNGLSLANPVDLTTGLPIVGGAFQAIYQNFAGNCGNEAQNLEGAMGTFTYDGTSAYSYLGTPASAPSFSASAVVPSTGAEAGGEVVQIQGAFFDLAGTYSVEFGAGNFATGVSVLDACTLECTTPAGSGNVDVIVTDTVLLGTSTIAGGFTFVQVFNCAPTNIAALGDDSSVNVAFTSGSFTFYGVAYTDLYINSNGNITFTGGDSDFSETTAEMLNNNPRIAPFYDDMHPGVGGTVGWDEDANTVTISYCNVPAYTTGDNSAVVTLDKNTGVITISYGTCTSYAAGTSCITGISAGGGLSAATGIDLTAGNVAAGANDAIFEVFTSVNVFDLEFSTITFTPGATYTQN